MRNEGVVLSPQKYYCIQNTSKKERTKVDESNFEYLIDQRKLQAVEEARLPELDIHNTVAGTRWLRSLRKQW